MTADHCGIDGNHPVPDGDGIRSCPCGMVTIYPPPTQEKEEKENL